MGQRKIRVLIVEDDPEFCFSIQNTLLEADMEVAGVAGTAQQALAMALERKPDIALMDLCLTESRLDGIEAGKAIRLQTPAKVLILTSYEDMRTIREACCRSFASGYIFKSQFELLVETIRRTAAGHTPQEYLIFSLILSELSPAEYSILELLTGKDLKLQSSPKTISNQKSHLLKKLGLGSQEELLHIFKGML